MISVNKNNQKGSAVLVWILASIALVMVLLIAVPAVGNSIERNRIEKDERHEQTAWDSAYLRYAAGDHDFEAVYDYENKQWIENLNGIAIDGYGESKENKGKVIFAKCDTDGNIILKWEDPLKFRAER